MSSVNLWMSCVTFSVHRKLRWRPHTCSRMLDEEWWSCGWCSSGGWTKPSSIHYRRYSCSCWHPTHIVFFFFSKHRIFGQITILAKDINHYRSHACLTIIACFAFPILCVETVTPFWCMLRCQLEQIFYKRGAPVELLCDNDTIFRGRRFMAFAAQCGVLLHFRLAYAQSVNGITKSNDHTVKVVLRRSVCERRGARLIDLVMIL